MLTWAIAYRLISERGIYPKGGCQGYQDARLKELCEELSSIQRRVDEIVFEIRKTSDEEAANASNL